MYHCHIRFYFMGHQKRIFEIIRDMPSLEHFTHEFFEGDDSQDGLAATADVILADLRGMDERQAVQALISGKDRSAELIVLAEQAQIANLTDALPEIRDIWTVPMAEEEIRFRFLRWQQIYKQEKDFWQTNQYFEATINNVPNLIWYKDREGIHRKVNDSFCETVNKTKEQVEGRGHAYIWNVEHDDPACIESEKEVMSQEKTLVSEETIKTGDGTRLLTTYKSPLYDCDGSVMGTVGVAIDITQERAYEQEIIKKSRSLEMVFTTMDCGVICHSIDGSHIISINKAALKILGYETQEELIGDGFDTVAASVLNEDKPIMRKRIGELKKAGDNVNIEYRVRHKNGNILNVMGNIKLVEEGGVRYYQRYLLDCTIQKQQEEKRQKENERRQMELVYALSMDYNLVYYFDLDTGMGIPLRVEDESLTIEPAASGRILMSDCMEHYIQKFVYEDDQEMLRQASLRDNLKKELSEKSQYYINYRSNRDGEIKYYQMKAVRTGTEKDNPGIVIGFHSVDEEIRNEMEQNNILENALIQANRANEAKSVFLSNMSHDIRTPMNAIVGFTTLAVSHIDNKEKVKGYLEKIKSSGDHLLNLINDVLDMSRIESGKVHLEEDSCNLPEILNDLRAILQAGVQEKQLDLHMETVHVQDENVICDKLRLNQVLLNLTSNSVKYTNEGGNIRVILTEKAGHMDGSATYEFRIVDNGIGMSDEFVAHVFEPFERERNSTISGIQGTGLGMAITKNIVDMMNGTIEVKSKEGVGTEIIVCFTFRLDVGKNDSQAISKEADSSSDTRIRSGRILLAEDVPLNQEIAVTILEEEGFCTEVAGDGKIAVDMVRNSEPGYYELVLMDIQMPEMNGYEATRQIRNLENKELASIPILAMSANAFEEDRQMALKCGMNGHIAKPIDIGKLFETLDEVLKKKNQ